MKVHYTEPYLLNPPHQVTVDLIGLGGTGSQMLTNLARIHQGLVGFGHPGLFIRAWDPDVISEANIGRQLFSPADIGGNKAVVLVSRVNAFFGLDWQAMPYTFKGVKFSNLTISCIDTAKGRLEIDETFDGKAVVGEPTNKPIYWLDLGNLQKTGQVVLGTIHSVKQPKSDHVTASVLANVVKKFPQLKRIKEKDQGPSCSLAEAVRKQDLFINSTLAQLGANIIWKLFREGMIRHHGCFLNLDNMIVNPMPIK